MVFQACVDNFTSFFWSSWARFEETFIISRVLYLLGILCTRSRKQANEAPKSHAKSKQGYKIQKSWKRNNFSIYKETSKAACALPKLA